MDEPRLASLRNPWLRWSSATLLAIVLVAGALGFLAVPYSQSVSAPGLWEAICRAAGALQPPPSGSARGAVAPRVPSEVVVTPAALTIGKESEGHGATLAMQCTMCHGARGVSEANTPNLAGQGAMSTYKQLRDFRSAHRASAVMAPLVQNLTDQDMRDLAAYYASLPPPRNPGERAASEMPVLVRNGAPMRNIAPCAACHGGDTALKTGAARLEGNSAVYLKAQLVAFAAGMRKNDINAQMRNVARNMTLEEMDQVSRYYAGTQP